MNNKHRISRIEFLRLFGIALVAAFLKACTSRSEITTPEIPTETSNPPTEIPGPSPTVINHITPRMGLVEAGEFLMGSSAGYQNEKPIHQVAISHNFYIGVYEVTFEEFDVFCEDTLRFNKPDDDGKGRGKRPVIGVDWDDAVEYCNWLSEKEDLTQCYSGKGKVTQCDFAANGYRLPTEAEWEYAARGGQNGQGYIYAGSDNPNEVAWYVDNSKSGAHLVGQKASNELGLFDMSGNRFEWCWDWYLVDYYLESPALDPRGPPRPQVDSPFDLVRVRRGGSWGEKPENIRVSTRSFDAPNYPGGNGFRLVKRG